MDNRLVDVISKFKCYLRHHLCKNSRKNCVLIRCTNLSGLFLRFFSDFFKKQEESEKCHFLELDLLTYLCLYQVFKDPFIFRMNFQNINISIKQNQTIKKQNCKTTVPRLHSKSRAVKTQSFLLFD